MIINEFEIKKEFEKREKDYYLFGKVLLDRINEILKESDVAFDYVQMRVKKFDSFYEKIFREHLTDPLKQKGETDPFITNKDFVGLRIIHLFEDDLLSIIKILKTEFISEGDKNLTQTRRKSEKEFTYRSYHFLISLKGDLKRKYPELAPMKAEVQIRTICMHTWAAIEHKLNYKKQGIFPKDYRPKITRKFSQMSAVLEIADEFFIALRNEKDYIIKQYKSDLSEPDKKEKVLQVDLNIDVLQAYIENNYYKYKQEKSRIKYLLDEMKLAQVGLREIEEGEKILKQENIYKYVIDNYPAKKEEQTQTGVVRLILDITNQKFYDIRKTKKANSEWLEFVNSIRLKLFK